MEENNENLNPTIATDGNPEQKAPTRVSFSKGIFSGKSFDDMNLIAENYNVPVVLETEEEFMTKFADKGFNQRELSSMYDKVKKAYDIYQAGIGFEGFSKLAMPAFVDVSKTGGLKEKADPASSFLRANEMALTGGGVTEIFHKDELSELSGYYVDRFGDIRSLRYSERAQNPLKRIDFKNGNSIWVESEDNELIDADKIRSWYGPRDLTSAWYTSIGTGLTSGLAGEVMKGVGTMVGLVGYGFDSIFSNDFEVKDKWYYQFNNEAINFANSLWTKNTDEEQGMFEKTNSFLFNFGNGVGQLIGIIATGYIGSPVGAGLGRILGPTSARVLSSTGLKGITKYKATQAIAQNFSRYFVATNLGASEATAGVLEQMRQEGFTYEESAEWLWMYYTASFLVESVVSPVPEKIGTRLFFKNTINRASAKAFVREAMEKELKHYGVNTITDLPPALRKKVRQRLIDSFQKYRKKAGTLTFDAKSTVKKAGEITMLSGLEGGEEVVEGYAHDFIRDYHNGMMSALVNDYQNFYEGAIFEPVNIEDGDIHPIDNPKGNVAYKMYFPSNPDNVTFLSEIDFNNIAKRLELFRKVENGEDVLPTEWAYMEDFVMAASTTMFTFGLGNVVGVLNPNSSRIGMVEMAKRVIKDPAEKERLTREFENLKQEGFFGSTTMSQRTDQKAEKAEMSEADARIQSIMEQLDFTVNVLNHYGLESEVALAAINSNSKISALGFSVAEELYRVDAALEALKMKKEDPENKEIPDPDYSGIEFTFTDPITGQKMELTKDEKGLILKKELLDRQLDYFFKPREFSYVNSKGKTKTSKRSAAYAAYYLSAMVPEYTMQKMADEKATKQATREDGSIDQAVYDKVRQREYEMLKGDPEKVYTRILKEGSALHEYSDFFKNGLFNRHIEHVKQELANAKRRGIMDNFGDTTVAEIMSQAEKTAEEIFKVSEDAGNIPTAISSRVNELIDALNNVFSSIAVSESIGEGQLSIDAKNQVDEKYKRIVSLFNEWEGSMKDHPLAGDMSEIVERQRAITRIEESSKANAENILSSSNFDALYQDINHIVDFIDNMQIPELANEELSTISEIMALAEKIKGKDTPIPNPIALQNYINILDDTIDDKGRKKPGLITRLKGYINYNTDFFQNTIEQKEEGEETSPIVTRTKEDPDNVNHLRFTKEQAKEALDHLEEVSAALDRMKEKMDEEVVTNSIAIHSNWFANVAMKYRVISQIFETLAIDEKTKKILGPIIKEIENIISKKVNFEGKERTPKNITELYELFYPSYLKDRDPKQVKGEKDEEKRKNIFSRLFGSKKKENSESYEYVQRLLDIEGLIVKAISSLSGQLNNIVPSFGNDIDVLFTQLKDFTNNKVNDDNIASIGGMFSEKSFLKGAEDYKNKKQTQESSMFIYYMKTFMNRINKFGTNGPSYQSAINAMYRVLANQEEFSSVPTYEQQEILLHAIGFLFNPENDWMTEGYTEENLKYIINRTLFIRGYAGTGKTKFIPTVLIKMYKELTGKKPKITVFVPNEALKNDTEKAYKESGVLGEADIEFRFSDEILEYNEDDSDFYILDEVSAYPEEMVEKDQAFKSIVENTKKPWIFLGDDSQTVPMTVRDEETGERWPRQNSRYPLYNCGEKTMPLTMVMRTGVKMFHDLQDFFREYYPGGALSDMPRLKWKESVEVPGTKVGGEYFSNKEKVIKAFIERMKKVNNESVFLLVNLASDKEKLLQEYDELKDLADNIKTVEYDYYSFLDNKDNLDMRKDFVSGLGPEEVFAAIDFVNDQLNGEKFFNENYPESKIILSRVGLMISSRPTRYLAMVGNEENNKMLEKGEDDSSIAGLDSDQSRVIFNSLNWDTVMNEDYGRLPNVVSEADVTPIKKDLNRDMVLSKDATDLVRKTTKEKIAKLAYRKNMISFKENKSGNRTRVSDHIFALYNNETVEDNDENAESVETVNEKTKSWGGVWAAAIRYVQNPSSKTYEDNLNDAIKNYSENVEPVKDIDGFKISIINSLFLNKDIYDVITNGIPVTNVMLTSELHTGEGVYGTPAFLSIVGYTQETYEDENGIEQTEIIPIVDIYDFIGEKKDVSDPRKSAKFDYNVKKHAAYALMLAQNGFKLNSVKLATVNLDVNENETTYGEFTEVTSEELFNVMPEIADYFIGEEAGLDMNDIYATDEEFFTRDQERVYRGVVPGLAPGDRFVDRNNTELRIDEIVLRGNELYAKYTTVPSSDDPSSEVEKGSIKIEDIPDRLSRLLPYKTAKFKSTAESYSRGELYSSSVVKIFPAGVGGMTIDIKEGDNFFDKENKLLKARQIVLRTGDILGGVPITKSIYEGDTTGIEFDYETGKVETVSKDHSHGGVVPIVVNRIENDEVIERIIATSVELQEILKNDKGLSEVEAFKANGLDILSVDANPEIAFSSEINTEQNAERIISRADVFSDKKATQKFKELLNTDSREAAERIADDIMKGRFEGDIHEAELITLNKDRLMRIWDLKHGGSQEWYVSRITNGSVMLDSKVRTHDEIIKSLETNGVQIERKNGEIVYHHEERSLGRRRVYINVYRNNPSKPERVYFNGRVAVAEDFAEMRKGIKEAEQEMNETIKILEESYKHSKGKAKTKEFHSLYAKVWRSFTKTEAMQFIKNNRSTLGKYLQGDKNLLDTLLEIDQGRQIWLRTKNPRKAIDNLMTALDAIEKLKDERWYMTPHDEGLDNYIPENMVGQAKTLGQSQVFLSSEQIRPEETETPFKGRVIDFDITDEGYNLIAMGGVNYSFINEDIAKGIIKGIIGERPYGTVVTSKQNAWDWVDQAWVLGNTSRHMITLYQFHPDQNKIEFAGDDLKSPTGRPLYSSNAARHESMHFVMMYLVDPVTARKVLDQARKDYATRFGVPPGGIDDRLAHEHIATMFEFGHYRKPRTTLEKFITWLRLLVQKWFGIFGFQPKSLDEIMYAADRGYYKNKRIRLTDYSDFSLNRVKNEYTNSTNKSAAVKTLGGAFKFSEIASKYVTEMIIANSNIGKNFNKLTQKDVGQAIQLTHQQMMERMQAVSANTKRKIRSSTTYEYVEKTIAQMDGDDFKMALGDPVSNKKIINDYIDYHLGTLDGMVVLQEAIGDNLDLDAVLEGMSSGIKSKGYVPVNNDTLSTEDFRSNYTDMFIRTIPLYNRVKGNRIKGKYVSPRIINGILHDAAQTILRNKGDKTLKNLFETIEHRMQFFDDAITKNMAYSFLISVGHMVNDRVAENITENGIEGIGMYALTSGDQSEYWTKKLKKKFGANKVLAKKVEYSVFLNNFWSEYFSAYMRVQLVVDYKAKDQYEIATNNDSLVRRANLKRNISSKVYKNSGGVRSAIVKNLVNPGQKILDIENGKVVFLERVLDNNNNLVDINETVLLDKNTGYLSEEAAQLLFRQIGFSKDDQLSLNLLRKIKENKTHWKSLTDHLYHMLLVLKHDALMQQDVSNAIDKKVPSEKFQLGAEARATFDEIAEFYKSHNYTRYLKTVRQRVGTDNVLTDYVGEMAHPVIHDMWEFIDDVIVSNMDITLDNLITKIIRNTNDDSVHEFPRSSYLTDLFQHEKGNSNDFVNNIKSKIAEKGSMAKTPLTSGENFNNPILNGRIAFDGMMVFDGIKGYRRNKPYRRMTKEEMADVFINSMVIDSMMRDASYMKVFSTLDPIADKPMMPSFNWFAQKDGSYIALFDRKTYQMNTDFLFDSISDFIEYYARLKEIATKNFELVKGKTVEEAKAVRGVMEGRDYVIVDGKVVEGRGITQENNPYAHEALKNFKGKDFNAKMEAIRKAFDSSFRSYSNVLEKIGYKKDDSKFANKSKELGFPIENSYEESFVRKGEEGTEWHPMIEAAFWSYHIFNESMAHLTRESAYHYSSITDYVKRAAGMIAPRMKFNTEDNGVPLNKNARVIILNDLKDVHPSSDKEFDATDGYSILNPLYRRMLFRASGGGYGNVNNGPLKTVNYNYSPEEDNALYLKFAQFPITTMELKNSKFFRDMFRMMMGDLGDHVAKGESKSFFERALEEDLEVLMDEIIDFLNSEDGTKYRESIVDYVVFDSAVKHGSHNVRSIGNSINDYQIDRSLNDDSNVILVSNETLGVQNVTFQNTVEQHKTVPTQLLYTIGAFSQNEEIGWAVSSALAGYLEEGLDEVPQSRNAKKLFPDDPPAVAATKTRNAAKQFMGSLALKYGVGFRSNKKSRLKTNRTYPADVLAVDTINNVVKHVNEHLKPTMPGQNFIQAPSFIKIYWNGKDQQPYLAEDIGLNNNDLVDEVEDKDLNGLFEGRHLRPMEYESLGSKKTMRPMDIIIPFNYMVSFGITPDITLVSAMTISNIAGKKQNLYKPHHMSYEEYSSWLDEVLNNFLAKDVIGGMPISQAKAVLEKDKGLSDYTEIEAKLRLKDYYINFNKSLDAFAVRIPTTGAASASMARVVAFHNYADNTILTSPQKNFMDGSDYDIDPLQVYFRAFSKGKAPAENDRIKNIQNQIFDSVENFYKNPENEEFAMQAVDLESTKYTDKSLVDRANEYDKSDQSVHSNPGSAIEIADINFSGERLVGHFANLQNAISRFLSLNRVREYLDDEKAEKIFGKFGLWEKDKAMAAYDLIIRLVNAATDNAKYGGILGKLNVTDATSPLVAGMIFSGVDENTLFETLQNEEVVNAINMVDRSNKHSRTPAKIYDYLEDTQLIEYALIGEQVRRFTDILSLQQGIKPSPFDIYSTKSKIEMYLGGSIPEFISSNAKSVSSQLEYLEDISDARGIASFDIEEKIRKTFDLRHIIGLFSQLPVYLNSIDVIDRFISDNFYIYGNKKLLNSALSQAGRSGFYFKDDYEDFYHAAYEAYISLYVNERKMKVKLPAIGKLPQRSFNLSNKKQREWFYLSFPAYVESLKAEYRKNQFMNRVTVDTRDHRGNYKFVSFENSSLLDEYDKEDYRRSFDLLPENIRKAFRTYQLLTYGFSTSNGSFFDVVDPSLEKDFTDWIRNIETENDYFYSLGSLIVGNVGLAVEQNEDEMMKLEQSERVNMFTIRDFFDRKKRATLVKNDEGSYEVIQRNTLPFLNEYYVPNVQPTNLYDLFKGRYLKVFDNVSYDALNRLKETGEYFEELSFYSGVLTSYDMMISDDIGDRLTNRRDIRESTTVVSGEHVLLPGGLVAKIESNGYDLSLKLLPEKKKDVLEERRTLARSTRVAERFVDKIIGNMRKMFPRISIIKVDPGKLAEMGYPDSSAIIKGGKLYIDPFKMNHSTPIHELSHIFLFAIQKGDPKLYSELKNKAMELWDTDLGIAIRNEYEGLSQEGILQEIIAHIIGNHTEGKMENLLTSVHSNTPGLAQKIIKSLSTVINRLLTFVKNLMNGSFGLRAFTSDMMDMSIQQVGEKLFDAFKQGKVISRITSDDVDMMTSLGTVLEERETIKKNSALFNAYTRASSRSSKLTEHQRIERMRITIKKNGNELPGYILGTKEYFDDPDSDHSTKKIKDILKRIDQRNKVFFENIMEYLGRGANPEQNIEVFGKTKDDREIVTMETLNRFNGQIEYTNSTKYFRYSELKKDPKFKGLFSDIFDDIDPIISMVELDGRYVLSIYDVSGEYLEASAKRGIHKNFLNEYMSNARATQRKVTLSNSEMDVRKLSLALMAQNMMQNNSNVYVENIAHISLSKNSSRYHAVDMVDYNKNIRALSQVNVFMDSISSDFQKIFKGKLFIPMIPYEDLLRDFYNENRSSWDGAIKKFVEKGDMLTTNERLNLIRDRLLKIMKKDFVDTSFTPGQMKEIKMLVNSIRFIRGISPLDNQVNTTGDLGSWESRIFDANSIGEESVQYLRDIIMESANKIVYEARAKRKTLDKLVERARNLYAKSHPGMIAKGKAGVGVERIVDLNKYIFDQLFVKKTITTMKDGRMVTQKVNTGFIYWTNNENEAKGVAKEHAREARKLGLSKELLDLGRDFLDFFEDMLIQQVIHERKMNPNYGYAFIKQKDGTFKEFGREEAIEEIENNDNYIRGMIPIIPQSSGERLSTGKVGGSVKKFFTEITDVTELFDSMTVESEDNGYVRRLGDHFRGQFGFTNNYDMHTELGVTDRTEKLLGLKEVSNADGSREFELESKSKNSMVSQNLERAMNYYMMTVIRNQEYEENVLPAINGAKVLLRDMQDNKGIDTKETITYINQFTKMAIEGERVISKKGLGKTAENIFLASMRSVTPLVLAGNLNIPVIGAVTQVMYAATQALPQTLFSTGLFNIGDLTKASGIVLKDFWKVGAIAEYYNVINMNEEDLLNFRLRQKSQKSVFSSYHANWANWAVDYYARCVVMVAQMLRDGSYYAHSIDKSTGEVVYDEKKDTRYHGATSEKGRLEQKILRENMKKQLIIDGIWGEKENEKLSRGYDLKTARVFKALSDKYVVGAYDAKTKSILGNWVIGAMVQLFNNWFMPRLSNALNKSSYSGEIGRYVVVPGRDGKYETRFQREFMGGFIRTVYKHLLLAVQTGSIYHMHPKRMSTGDKQNWIRFLTNTSLFLAIYQAYSRLVDSWDDDEKPIPNWRIVRNIKYAADSLLIFPTILEKINEPAAAVYIIKNMLFTKFGVFRLKAPTNATIKAIAEPWHYFVTGEEYFDE